jgi:hypothetical protein
MSKFKVGDKVVVVKHTLPCRIPIGTTTVVTLIKPWGVLDVEDSANNDRFLGSEELEHFEIWNSPLYQALFEGN